MLIRLKKTEIEHITTELEFDKLIANRLSGIIYEQPIRCYYDSYNNDLILADTILTAANFIDLGEYDRGTINTLQEII